MLEGRMDRRTAVRRGAAALLGLGVAGCAYPVAGPAAAPAAAAPRRAWLPPPRVSDERVVRTVAGLRPYRPSGFRVEAERLGDALLIHNYGHGGAGVTLSWGSGWLALEHALAQPHRDAAVIGCGAVGLATARLLQDHGFRVRIYARDLPPNTTSNVSGALWAPYGVSDWGQRETHFGRELLPRAARIAHRWFRSLLGEEYGVRWLPLYQLSDAPRGGLPWMMAVTPELYNARALEPHEHPFAAASVWRANSMVIEPDVYLRALMRDFRAAGGEIVVRAFQSPEQLRALPERVLVNCTGLGARALFGDEELVPVRGQLAFLLPQPEIEYMYTSPYGYMFPRRGEILLGGTNETGEWSVEPEPDAIARILEGNRRVAEGMTGMETDEATQRMLRTRSRPA